MVKVKATGCGLDLNVNPVLHIARYVTFSPLRGLTAVSSAPHCSNTFVHDPRGLESLNKMGLDRKGLWLSGESASSLDLLDRLSCCSCSSG